MRITTIISIAVLITVLLFPAAGICQDSEKLNLNDATVEQLIKIPGIDEEMPKKLLNTVKNMANTLISRSFWISKALIHRLSD